MARLVNPPLGDPALYVRLRERGEALLFDAGDLTGLETRELLRVRRLFVTHTHMDHFIGFDRLVRTLLDRSIPLAVYGPPGIVANLRGRLAGYTWNHASAYPLELEAHEVGAESIACVRLAARERFLPRGRATRPFTDVVHEERDYCVKAVTLDHLVPCLGFALETPPRLNVRAERLGELGLKPGVWLERVKQAIRDGRSDATPIVVEDGEAGRVEPLRRLRRELIRERSGEKLAYVVDVRFTDANAKGIVALARGADVFFCEAHFLDADRERAFARAHLTARQAGSLARAAGVGRLVPFHYSRRYGEDPAALYEEANDVLRGALSVDVPDQGPSP